MPETLTPQIEGVSEEALKERIHLRRVKDSVSLFDQLIQAGTPVSLETTNSLLDLLCFYGDGESTPEEEKEDLEEPGHGASTKAYDMYIDLLNERHKADVHTFNALITAVPYLKERFLERWELAKVFLNHMAQQKVQPNLLTFNALLKTLRRCGGVGRSLSLLVIKEMEALDIVDLLPSGIISEVLDDVEKRSFTPQDPDDANFFATAMQVCCDLKDIRLAYRLNKAMEKGDNWKFLDMVRLNAYWSKFFSLLCMMEQIDVVLKWYKEMSPSLFYPTPKNILDLLQALDAANHLEAIPSVWEDMKQLGFNRKQDLLEELLSLMSRDQHPDEIQLAFAKCAEDIKAAHEQTGREQAPLEWTGHALGHVAVLFSRAGRTQDACDQVMDEFLNCAKQTNCPDEAIKLVKLAVSLGLPSSQRLKSRMEKEFELSEKQKKTLESIKSDSNSSDSDSDSDSDRD
ncbi:PREDICTED: pentatricopeptide repeat domain-containing protein 3, mitochondrial [Phaethon lepturus]|uniref:pentatricopeptide repeat domain-containing protein 3, mitochondrial n=1 Tax=Phaethon lepturus TaxID=97097 RepID=UPI0005306642|nr:PREDICTED: pentatricopeptide repeat domain-containing protein 3, mitochondrial [Phaethon lepturus]